jgi:hypothetical protein
LKIVTSLASMPQSPTRDDLTFHPILRQPIFTVIVSTV